MRKYLECLSQRHAAVLLLSNLFGRLPNGMGTLAIVLFLRSQGWSYERVGAAAAVYGLCSAVGGPTLGRLVDRRGQVLTLIVGAVISSAAFALLALLGGDQGVTAWLAVGLAGFFMPPLEPALRSMWPSVLPENSLVGVAYALDAALQNVLYVAGPLLVVFLVGITSSTAVLYQVAALGILGTLTYITIPPVRAWRGQAGARDWAGPLRSRLMLTLLGSLLCTGAAVGVLNVNAVAYAEELDRPGLSGVLLGAYSLGSMIGGLLYGARTWSGDPVGRLALLMLMMAGCALPLAVVPGADVMVPLMAVAGFGLAPVLICSFVVIGAIAPAGTVTEAFAWVTAVFLAGSAVGSATAGVAISTGGLRTAFAAVGVAAVIAFLVALAASRSRSRPTKASTQEQTATTQGTPRI